jgi:hypothetical protein
MFKHSERFVLWISWDDKKAWQGAAQKGRNLCTFLAYDEWDHSLPIDRRWIEKGVNDHKRCSGLAVDRGRISAMNIQKLVCGCGQMVAQGCQFELSAALKVLA